MSWNWVDRNTILHEYTQQIELFDYIMSHSQQSNLQLLCRVCTQSIFASFSKQISTSENKIEYIKWIIQVYEWISEWYMMQQTLHEQALICSVQLLHQWYPLYIQLTDFTHFPTHFLQFINYFCILQFIISTSQPDTIPMYQLIDKYSKFSQQFTSSLQMQWQTFLKTEFIALKLYSHWCCGNIIAIKTLQKKSDKIMQCLIEQWIQHFQLQIWNHLKKAFFKLELSVASKLLGFVNESDALDWIRKLATPVSVVNEEWEETICVKVIQFKTSSKT